MFSLVLYRNVDFTIQEFANTSDLAYTFQGKRLIPVPGIKLVLDGSRHFLVSKKHKNGKKVYQALEKGLKILREKGTVQRYLTESGFYRKELESWKPIYVD